MDVQAGVDLHAQLIEEVLDHQGVIREEALEAPLEVAPELRHARLDDHLPVPRTAQTGAVSQAEGSLFQREDLHE